ncbi:MAG: RNA ligase [Nitrospirota bacterium]
MNKVSPPSFVEKYFSGDEITKIHKKNALQTYKFKEIILLRLVQDHKKYPRGTIFYEDGFIAGYPRIMRVLHLRNGINRYFKEGFYIEEKVDGYNVRVAVINGDPLVFTRGGFVCPFTTHRISNLMDLDFFKKYPDYIICGEVVGPGSPYNTEVVPYVKEDVIFFAFDIFEKNGKNISIEERYSILEQFRISQVRRWGPFVASDMDTVKGVILDLDREDREGVVIKPVSQGRTIKYVTLSSCLKDLQATADLVTELPAGFYMQRILRSIFISHEFGIPLRDDYLLESAKALYLSPGKVLEEVAGGGNVKESFQIKVKNKSAIYELMEHLKRSGVITKILYIESFDDHYIAKFQRIYSRSSREIRRLLAGHGFYD